VFFKAGLLGTLEEMRDEKLVILVTMTEGVCQNDAEKVCFCMKNIRRGLTLDIHTEDLAISSDSIIQRVHLQHPVQHPLIHECETLAMDEAVF